MAQQFQLVRLKKGKKHFEVMTNMGTVLKFRDGRLGFDKVLVTDIIFKNQHKGEHAKGEDLKAAFGTDNVRECLEIIVKKGELQVSAKERAEMREKKKNEILEFIHRNYTDPKMNKPHPVKRLELAMDASKFRVDPNQDTSEAVSQLVKLLQGKLALSKSEIEGTLSVKHAHIGAVTGVVHKFAHVVREKYTPTGCSWMLGVSPGEFDSFVAALNKVTKGDFQWLVAGQESSMAAEPEEGKKGRKKKKKGRKR